MQGGLIFAHIAGSNVKLVPPTDILLQCTLSAFSIPPLPIMGITASLLGALVSTWIVAKPCPGPEPLSLAILHAITGWLITSGPNDGEIFFFVPGKGGGARHLFAAFLSGIGLEIVDMGFTSVDISAAQNEGETKVLTGNDDGPIIVTNPR